MAVLFAVTAIWLTYECVAYALPIYHPVTGDLTTGREPFFNFITIGHRGPLAYVGYYFMIEFFRILVAMGKLNTTRDASATITSNVLPKT